MPLRHRFHCAEKSSCFLCSPPISPSQEQKGIPFSSQPLKPVMQLGLTGLLCEFLSSQLPSLYCLPYFHWHRLYILLISPRNCSWLLFSCLPLLWGARSYVLQLSGIYPISSSSAVTVYFRVPTSRKTVRAFCWSFCPLSVVSWFHAPIFPPQCPQIPVSSHHFSAGAPWCSLGNCLGGVWSQPPSHAELFTKTGFLSLSHSLAHTSLSAWKSLTFPALQSLLSPQSQCTGVFLHLS